MLIIQNNLDVRSSTEPNKIISIFKLANAVTVAKDK